MKKRGHAVRYPPGVGGVMGKFYNMLLDDGHVDSKLLGKVFDGYPTLFDKVNFLSAVLLQPPTDQQREWIEAFGLAWRWTDVLYQSHCGEDSVVGDLPDDKFGSGRDSVH